MYMYLCLCSRIACVHGKMQMFSPAICPISFTPIVFTVVRASNRMHSTELMIICGLCMCVDAYG